MQSLPKGDLTRAGFLLFFLFLLFFSFLSAFNKSINDCEKYILKFRQIIADMAEMVNEMVSAVDDGDGEIDYDEFVSMIQKY